MKIKYKILLWIVSLILIPCFFYVGAWYMAPGSYARAEIYDLKISEDSLAQIVKDFKTENPDLVLTKPVHIPNGSEYFLKDGRRDSTDNWFHIYFYYSDKNQIVNTWIRQNIDTTTQFAFVDINNGLTLGNWIEVNESIWWWKNRPIKEEFENRILKKIKEKLKEKKNNSQ
jgi:hypothetical protein